MTTDIRPLRLVPAPKQPLPATTFCSHCGRAAQIEPPPRVCSSCGLGVVLRVPQTAKPSRQDPFLVVDVSMKVKALSRHAESLLQTSEPDALDHQVTDFFVAAEAEGGPSDPLTAMLIEAALGAEDVSEIHIRPANTFGVRWKAVVAPCGPPQAALLVLVGAK